MGCHSSAVFYLKYHIFLFFSASCSPGGFLGPSCAACCCLSAAFLSVCRVGALVFLRLVPLRLPPPAVVARGVACIAASPDRRPPGSFWQAPFWARAPSVLPPAEWLTRTK